MWPFHRRAARGRRPSAGGVTPRRPHAGLLRREERTLLAVREEKLRDLGGLAVELYRRGSFREDLIAEGCAEVVGIDARLAEIDELLRAGRTAPPRCSCGAPVLRGSRFCPSCGRALDGRDGAGGEDTVIARPETP
ncbi:MAG TPA: hypothetical protein VFB42_08345 [Gaiellaceae bacterium]|nr:hypothetical protein [Gaiellaceae bacterium]